jgi:hypothetical protein
MNPDCCHKAHEEESANLTATATTPNPSIERDVQGLSPSAAPHVKR